MPKCIPRMSTTTDTGKSKDSAISPIYPILTRGNYTLWVMNMRVNIQAHGIWEAIEPKGSKVIVEEKVEKAALAAIYQGVPDDILLTLAEKNTTKERGRR